MKISDQDFIDALRAPEMEFRRKLGRMGEAAVRTNLGLERLMWSQDQIAWAQTWVNEKDLATRDRTASAAERSAKLAAWSALAAWAAAFLASAPYVLSWLKQ